MKQTIVIAGLASAAALALGAVAWTQVQRQTGPTPAVVALQPTRAETAALAEARKDPLGERLRGVMRQDPAAASVLQQIQASSVPVLGPADPALLRTAVFVPGDRHYMLVVERGAQVIEIYGATKAFQSPVERQGGGASSQEQAPPATFARRAPSVTAAIRQAEAAGLSDIHVEQTEYGTDVAFNRFGAAYNLSFICESQGAAGCGPVEAVAFAIELRLLGGGGQ